MSTTGMLVLFVIIPAMYTGGVFLLAALKDVFDEEQA